MKKISSLFLITILITLFISIYYNIKTFIITQNSFDYNELVVYKISDLDTGQESYRWSQKPLYPHYNAISDNIISRYTIQTELEDVKPIKWIPIVYEIKMKIERISEEPISGAEREGVKSQISEAESAGALCTGVALQLKKIIDGPAEGVRLFKGGHVYSSSLSAILMCILLVAMPVHCGVCSKKTKYRN